MTKVFRAIVKLFNSPAKYYRHKFFKDSGVTRGELLNYEKTLFIIFVIFLLLFYVCLNLATMKFLNFDYEKIRTEKQNEFRKELVVFAEEIRQKNPFYDSGMTNPNDRLDCSGFMTYIFSKKVKNGIRDIYYNENGVKQIYKYCNEKGYVHKGQPDAGDIVFISPLLDDGRTTAYLRHVGMVTNVFPKQRVFWYIHQTSEPLIIRRKDKSEKYIYTKTAYITRENSSWTGWEEYAGTIESFATVPYDILPGWVPKGLK